MQESGAGSPENPEEAGDPALEPDLPAEPTVDGLRQVDDEGRGFIASGNLYSDALKSIGTGNLYSDALKSIGTGNLYSDALKSIGTGNLYSDALKSIGAGNLFADALKSIGNVKPYTDALKGLASFDIYAETLKGLRGINLYTDALKSIGSTNPYSGIDMYFGATAASISVAETSSSAKVILDQTARVLASAFLVESTPESLRKTDEWREFANSWINKHALALLFWSIAGFLMIFFPYAATTGPEMMKWLNDSYAIPLALIPFAYVFFDKIRKK